MTAKKAGGESARYMLTDLRPPPPSPEVQKAASEWMLYLAQTADEQAERLNVVLKTQDPPGIRAMRDYWKTASRVLRWAAKTSMQRKQNSVRANLDHRRKQGRRGGNR